MCSKNWDKDNTKDEKCKQREENSKNQKVMLETLD